MGNELELLRNKLNIMLLEDKPYTNGEILEISQELDSHIVDYYVAMGFRS